MIHIPRQSCEGLIGLRLPALPNGHTFAYVCAFRHFAPPVPFGGDKALMLRLLLLQVISRWLSAVRQANGEEAASWDAGGTGPGRLRASADKPPD